MEDICERIGSMHTARHTGTGTNTRLTQQAILVMQIGMVFQYPTLYDASMTGMKSVSLQLP